MRGGRGAIPGGGEGRSALEAELLHLLEEDVVGLLGLEGSGNLEVALLLDLIDEGDASPWGSEIDGDGLL